MCIHHCHIINCTLTSGHNSCAQNLLATNAEERKKSKYSSPSPLYDFTPIAVETLGAVGESVMDFFRQLGRHIAIMTAETRSFAFLMQHLS